MGKVAPEPLIPQRTHSGRSYWVRNILASTRDNADAAETNPTAKGVPKPPPTKKRFVEPYRLSDEQRAGMLAPLAELGVGDPGSRELFAAALAYDLATCYELTVANPDQAATEAVGQASGQPSAQWSTEVVTKPTSQAPTRSTGRNAARPAPYDPALDELALAAQALAGHLDNLEVAVRARLLEGLREGDRFRRGYQDDYLNALCVELLRIAASVGASVGANIEDAVATLTPAVPTPKKPAAPKPSPAARQFIARAAGAFEECFDQAPTAQVGGPFAAMLRALVEVTGVRIPTDPRNLAELLKRT